MPDVRLPPNIRLQSQVEQLHIFASSWAFDISSQTRHHSTTAMAHVDVQGSPSSPEEKNWYSTRPSDDEDLTDKRMSIGKYAATRLTTLKPPMEKVPNPIKLLALLNTQQWLFFLVAFLAWTWDAFDFFTVSLTVSDLAEDFGKSNTDITWGITLVLMFRSVGSTIFGIAADRYGRKWCVYRHHRVPLSTRLTSSQGRSLSTTSSSSFSNSAPASAKLMANSSPSELCSE